MEETDKASIPKDTLKQIIESVKILVSRQEALAQLERRVEEQKNQIKNLSEGIIPELMKSVSLSVMRLDDGTEVKIDRIYGCGITEENTDRAFKWLEKNGHGGMIKTKVDVTLEKGDDRTLARVRKALAAIQVGFNEKASVHPMTLKAFVREQIEGDNGPFFPRDLFSVQEIDRVKIKKG